MQKEFATFFGGPKNLTKEHLSAVLGISETQASDLLRRFDDVTGSMDRMARSGNATSSSLNSLNVKMNQLRHALTQVGITSAPLRRAHEELLTLSQRSRLASDALYEAGKQQMFLSDATDLTRNKVQQLASGMQGFMLATSLLDFNLQHLAFSLIFLQFAGSIKAALGFGVLTLAIGGLIKVMTKWHKSQKEAQQLNDAFVILTGNEQGLETATKLATDAVEAMGIKGEDAEKSIKALAIQILNMHMRGIQPTSRHMQVFVATLLSMKHGLTDSKGAVMDWEQAIDSAGDSFNQYLMDVQAGGAPMTIDFGGSDIAIDMGDDPEGRIANSLQAYMNNYFDRIYVDLDPVSIRMATDPTGMGAGGPLPESVKNRISEEGKGLADAFNKGWESALRVGVGSAAQVVEDQGKSMKSQVEADVAEGILAYAGLTTEVQGLIDLAATVDDTAVEADKGFILANAKLEVKAVDDMIVDLIERTESLNEALSAALCGDNTDRAQRMYDPSGSEFGIDELPYGSLPLPDERRFSNPWHFPKTYFPRNFHPDMGKQEYVVNIMLDGTQIGQGRFDQNALRRSSGVGIPIRT